MRLYLFIVTYLLAFSAAAAGSQLTICINYHCEQQLEIQLTPEEWHTILSPFSETASDAHAERVQISRAIALFEKTVGPHAGTSADVAENDGDGDENGQLDCIAESKNTEHYLNWLNKKGKLRWHTVEERIKRSPMLFDPHWSAVIKQRDNQRSYVVDSWFYANGEAPVIQSTDEWLNKESFNNQTIP